MTFRQSIFRTTAGFYPVACILAITFLSSNAFAQDITRRPLQHQDYDVWNTMTQSTLSNDGTWAMYTVQNGRIDGEATLHIHNTKTSREFAIERGAGGKITDDSRFVIFRITPEKKTLKKMRRENPQEENLPKPKLQVLELATGAVTTLNNVRSFQIPEENGNWVACLLEKPTGSHEVQEEKRESQEAYQVTENGLRRPSPTLKLKSREQLARERGEQEARREEYEDPKGKVNGKKESEKEADDDGKDKAAGTPLILIELDTGVQRTFPNVATYGFSKNGKIFAYSTSFEEATNAAATNARKKVTTPEQVEKESVDGLHVIKLDSMEHQTIASGTGHYKNMAITDDGSRIAFITDKEDRESETSTWALYLWSWRDKEAKKIATEGSKGLPSGWWISSNSNQKFSEDGRRLYFETSPIPDEVFDERASEREGREIKKDDQDEKAKLDVWHWRDPQLQPQQLIQAETERKRDYRAAYVLKSKKVLQLANRQIPDISIDYRSPSDVAVANTNMRYRRTLSWDYPGFHDSYLINLNTGKQHLVLEKIKWNVSMSPEGKFITWFDGETRKWYAKATADPQAKSIEISKGIRHPLQNELHDTPNSPRAYGSAGWMPHDRAFLIYDRNDVWQLDPTGKIAPICLTEEYGRKNHIQFRYRPLDPQQQSIDLSEPIVLDAFNQKTKASGFYSLSLVTQNKAAPPKDKTVLRQLIMLDENLGDLKKAKDADTVLFTRSTFEMCPDLWSSTTQFEQIFRVSDMNPQQEEYSWGSAELVHWKSSDGKPLDGILLKPDEFDPSKKYPMMVYFYERNSDNLHRYYPPAAGRSIICHSFYVSRGYVVFIPDIPYKTGEPGASAANSILPGVEQLIAQGFIDRDRIGMQGHSWGGYQTAYLVTQTDMFACAESGAPVSNMTSAYGGIRWSSGLSRMFQYERTQSRIGQDLWAARDKYIANSPLFFADKINTPLLILHNDEDGAVPWYQGIELFVALRRLEKPAWMLNYNGNPHWVMGDYNRRDFAIRMQQFFDHYLLDAPEPEWMAVGIRAVDKGENFGLELLEPTAKEGDEKPAMK